jgi:hypothetical protein
MRCGLIPHWLKKPVKQLPATFRLARRRRRDRTPSIGCRQQAAYVGIDATSFAHRRKARTVSKMCDDDATTRETRVDRPQSLRNEFVRETVESVPSHTRLIVGATQAEATRQGIHRVMKCGIKACDLRHPWRQPRATANSRKVMRLMQRRKRLQPEKLLHHLIVVSHWGMKLFPP